VVVRVAPGNQDSAPSKEPSKANEKKRASGVDSGDPSSDEERKKEATRPKNVLNTEQRARDRNKDRFLHTLADIHSIRSEVTLEFPKKAPTRNEILSLASTAMKCVAFFVHSFYFQSTSRDLTFLHRQLATDKVKLKEENAELDAQNTLLQLEIRRMQEEMKQLREENERLKAVAMTVSASDSDT
jgi:molecular chaperone GrpE (heat shock protein)